MSLPTKRLVQSGVLPVQRKEMSQVGGSMWPIWEPWVQFPALWLQPDCCKHLGSNTVDGRSVSPPLPVTLAFNSKQKAFKQQV